MPDKLSGIHLLHLHECRVGSLYREYAAKFPDNAEFWNHIADDEDKHAAWIRECVKDIQEGTVVIPANRFKETPISTAIKYIEDEESRATSQEMTLMQAVSIARNIEQTMLDAMFFKACDSDSMRLKTMLDTLRVETARHIEEINQAWEDCRGFQKNP